MSDSYPNRGSKCLAHKVTRLLFKSCAVLDIGHHAVLLVIHVAHQEDAARYRGPVRFWNRELQDTLGFNANQLNNARKRAVAAGWFHYERAGGKTRSIGRYWVMIPPDCQDLDDSPVGDIETIHHPSVKSAADSSSERDESNLDSSSQDDENDTNPVMNPVKHSIPTPSPKEKREAAPLLPDGNALTADWLLEEWNKIDGVSRIREMTNKRRQDLRTRSKNAEWVTALPEALAEIAASPFCRGENDRGWRANVDWFLKPDTLTKILEGTYDDRGRETKPQSSSHKDRSNELPRR